MTNNHLKEVKVEKMYKMRISGQSAVCVCVCVRVKQNEDLCTIFKHTCVPFRTVSWYTIQYVAVVWNTAIMHSSCFVAQHFIIARAHSHTHTHTHTPKIAQRQRILGAPTRMKYIVIHVLRSCCEILHLNFPEEHKTRSWADEEHFSR